MPDPHYTPGSYAASDPGFAVTSLDELLAQHADLIARIKLCYGVDRDSYERNVLAMIRRYAAYVHWLPATADNYFSLPGGLLRLGLEAGFFSLQGTDAHIFSGRSTISARRQLEPPWRLATFAAGLCCELHRALSHVIVTDAHGDEWPACLLPLFDWLVARGSERYYLRWRPQAIEVRGLGLFALPHIVPPAVMQDLCEGNTVIVPQLMASIGGVTMYRDRNVLDELVRRSLALVIDRNLLANADRHGSPQFGSHLERYLVDALRRLASGNSSWVPNREKSRVWLGRDGLFLLWPGAAEDIHKLLEADQLPGIPKAPETLLELLLAAGVFVAPDSTRATWSIQPPGTKVPVEAAKLNAPAILFSGIDSMPHALEQQLVRAPGDPEPAPVPPPRPANASPQVQLSLLVPTASPPPQADPPPAEAAEAAIPAPPPLARTIALQAPLRLNPVVRDALATVVRTLNPGDGPARCCTVAAGVFIPLGELERHGVQSSQALRALSDVRMLAHIDANRPSTVTRDFNGTPSPGLVIDPRFIGGLDLDGFALPPADGA